MEDLTMEDKCEKLFSVVVESRKTFGQMCVDFQHKSTVLEKEMLKLQLESIPNNVFKPRNIVHNIEGDGLNDNPDDFTAEILARSKKIEEIEKKLERTTHVMLQMNSNHFERKVRKLLNTETVSSKAKEKS